MRYSLLPSRTVRRLTLAAIVCVTACVDGMDPVGVDLVRSVQIAAAPVFSVAPSAVESAGLSRARVTALDAATGASLGVVQQDIDPSEPEWTLELTIDVPEGKPLSIRLQTELASVSGGAESVEWSGRTAVFTVASTGQPQEIHAVNLFRGPLANLDVTGLTLTDVPAALLAGETAQVKAAIQGGAAGARVYFRSENPSVATVDGAGNVSAVGAGTTRIFAEAGPTTTSATVTVEDLHLPDPGQLDGAVGQPVAYTTSVLGEMGDAQGAAAISTSLTDLTTALAAGKGTLAVQAFEAAKAAWAGYGAGSGARALDAPQLGVVELTLISVADALGIPFG